MNCSNCFPRAICAQGGLAQMVERSLSMREAAGSMPASSIFLLVEHNFSPKGT